MNTNYSRGTLIQEATLSEKDLMEITKCRRSHNRLGFAYQIAYVKLYNQFPNQHPFKSESELLSFVATQIGVDEIRIEEYANRQHTVSEHQARIRDYLGYRSLGTEDLHTLEKKVFDESCRLEQAFSLLSQVRQYLKEQRILSPAESTLERIVMEQRKRARIRIFERISEQITKNFRETIDSLLEVKPGDTHSNLQQIKSNPNKPSAEAMNALTNKLEVIESTGALAIDISWLNHNYQRSLFHYVRNCSVNRLRKVEPARRHGSLVCFLWQSYHDAVDQVIDMFDKLITRVHTQAKQELDDQMCAQRRAIKVSLAMLDTIGSIVLNDDVSDSQLRSEIYARVPKSELTLRFAGISEWVSGKKSDWFHGVMRRHGYLRKFSPTFLKAIQFKLESEERSVPCMQAVDLLRELNDNGKRKLPDDAPIDFIPERLTPIVKEGNGLNRRAWECALLTKLRDEVKAGNIAVESSKRFGMFSDYFMPDLQWDSVRDSFFGRSELPSKPDKVHEYLSNRLEQAYDIFLKSVPGNSYATVDQDGWHLSVDSAEKIRRRIGKKIGEPSQLA